MPVLFAVVLFVLMGFVGIAVDYNRASGVKANMQAALDAAVLAAAKNSNNTPLTIANAYFTAAPISANSVNANFSQSGSSILGTATATVPTSFLQVLNLRNIDVKVTATATSGASNASPICIMVLSNTSQALTVNSGPIVQASKCEMHVLSTKSNAVIFNSGSTLNFSKICVASSSVIDNGGSHASLAKSCATASDPYVGKFPEPDTCTCDYNGTNYNKGPVTLNPGTYCGNFNFNGAIDVTFKPGVYAFKNSTWNVNGGNWSGTDVTFYFDDASSKIQFNSAVSTSLSAPLTGNYAGVLMFEKAGLKNSQLVFDDSKGSKLSGVIYLPSRDVTFNSKSSITGESFSLVTNTLILNSINWDLAPFSTSSTSGSASARLVK